MKYWKAGLAFFVAFMIQTSLLNLISIGGYTPNLLLCLVVVFSFMYENEIYGVVFGSVFGLLYDICFSVLIGPTPLALFITAVMILIVREFTNIENIFNLWMISALSLLVYYSIHWGFNYLGDNPTAFVTVAKMLPWTGLYSIAVITIIYSLLIRKVVKHRKDRYFR